MFLTKCFINILQTYRTRSWGPDSPKITISTIVSPSYITPAPRVTSRISPAETTQIKVRKDGVLNGCLNQQKVTSLSRAMSSAISNQMGTNGFATMVFTPATNVIDTKMSGISIQPQVRTF